MHGWPAGGDHPDGRCRQERPVRRDGADEPRPCPARARRGCCPDGPCPDDGHAERDHRGCRCLRRACPDERADGWAWGPRRCWCRPAAGPRSRDARPDGPPGRASPGAGHRDVRSRAWRSGSSRDQGRSGHPGRTASGGCAWTARCWERAPEASGSRERSPAPRCEPSEPRAEAPRAYGSTAPKERPAYGWTARTEPDRAGPTWSPTGRAHPDAGRREQGWWSWGPQASRRVQQARRCGRRVQTAWRRPAVPGELRGPRRVRASRGGAGSRALPGWTRGT